MRKFNNAWSGVLFIFFNSSFKLFVVKETIWVVKGHSFYNLLNYFSKNANYKKYKMSKQVLNLAVEISNTRDSEVPVKLLKVAGKKLNNF